MQEAALELVSENGLPPLPNGSFVFWMHQGYMMAFFKEDDGDNPPVYFYSEGNDVNDYQIISDSLLDYFKLELKNSGFILL